MLCCWEALITERNQSNRLPSIHQALDNLSCGLKSLIYAHENHIYAIMLVNCQIDHLLGSFHFLWVKSLSGASFHLFRIPTASVPSKIFSIGRNLWQSTQSIDTACKCLLHLVSHLVALQVTMSCEWPRSTSQYGKEQIQSRNGAGMHIL